MFGYFFVFCIACSAGDNWGPGYLGGSFRSLAGCDGGLNLAGFSRTRGLEGFLAGVFFEAWRTFRGVADGAARRVRHIRPL